MRFDVNINANIFIRSEDEHQLHRIETAIAALTDLVTTQGAHIMSALSDLQTAVAAEDTVIDSAVTLINGLAAQIAALTPDQDAINALAADVNARASALAAAISTNTPAAPPVSGSTSV